MKTLHSLRLLVLPCAAALLAACGEQELYGQLTERSANEMVAVLRSAGLAAEKQQLEGRFSVVTSSKDFPVAVRTLSAQGYPREQFAAPDAVLRQIQTRHPSMYDVERWRSRQMGP